MTRPSSGLYAPDVAWVTAARIHHSGQGNVTPGDAPGFPVTLSLPGSYRLSGNLTVLAPTDGIVITADRVTLDLNGFSLIGSGTASSRYGPMATLAPAFSRRLIQCVTGSTAVGNGQFDIHVGPASTVSDNNASRNGTGLRVEADTLVSRNVASRNRFASLVVNCPSVVIGNALTGVAVLDIGCTFDPIP